MKLDELNENQKRSMKSNIIKDYYNWNDNGLFSYILGELPLERKIYRYAGKSLTDEEKIQNEIINKINEIINKYNKEMKMSKVEKDKLDHLYSNLKRFIDLSYTSYNDINYFLKFNKVICISGPGGIGKSQFLYEFSEKIKGKFNYLCIYGKYCNNIENEVFAR